MNFKDFKDFKKDVESAFNAMIADNLFVVNVDKDLLWMSYLLSFEDETIRQDHNCNACKSFIRHYGKVVAIDPQTYKVKTFWDDVHTPGYEKTASDLAKLVKEAGIGDIFIQDVNEFHGCDHNVQLLPDGTTRTWTHLYVTIPNKFKFNRIFTVRGMISKRQDFLEQRLFSNTSKLTLRIMQIAELMSINLLTFVCSLNKLTVFNFEFNTCTVIIVS